MMQPEQVLAKILKSGARALAGYAAGEMPLGAETAQAAVSTPFDGWRVIQLGSNVPADDLAQAVEFHDADLVALSVSLPTQLTVLARGNGAMSPMPAPMEVHVHRQRQAAAEA
jgi:methanogenic corrinoid protein MtbC1